MDKNTGISLHLAKVMGLQNIQTAPEQYQVGERVTHELTDIRREIFNPFTNRAQWADVVLWAAYHGYDVALHTDTSYCMTPYKVFECSFEWPGSNEQDHIASTLKAIALATGWAG